MSGCKNKEAAPDNNVVHLFSKKPVNQNDQNKIVRLAPELDGLEMLYSNDANKSKMFSMKILCWALRKNGEVEAMIPWLSRLVPARDLQDPLNGHWEGYYDSRYERLFYDPPVHKVVELEGAATYFQTVDEHTVKPADQNLSGELEKPAHFNILGNNQADNNKEIKAKASSETPDIILQEIPDNIGTHAVLTGNSFQTITLTQITSWRLKRSGVIEAMIADTGKIDNTPVLPGDECLYPVQGSDDFKYFFHHIIANKIKAGDPDAMAAFSRLLDQ